jgi:hypothetical protein
MFSRQKFTFAANQVGNKIDFVKCEDLPHQIRFVVETIYGLVDTRAHKPGDFAVLYRSNVGKRVSSTLQKVFCAGFLQGCNKRCFLLPGYHLLFMVIRNCLTAKILLIFRLI